MPEAESFKMQKSAIVLRCDDGARHGVYVLGSDYFPSPFLEELMDDEENRGVVKVGPGASEGTGEGTAKLFTSLGTCPLCNKGRLPADSRKVWGFIGLLGLPELASIRAAVGVAEAVFPAVAGCGLSQDYVFGG